MLEYSRYNSELIFATVGGAGVDHSKIATIFSDVLQRYQYSFEHIHLSKIIEGYAPKPNNTEKNFERTMRLMDSGNNLREESADNSILALAAASEINTRRRKEDSGYFLDRAAYLVTSVKRPEEVARLRKIYAKGFYLFGVYSSPESRKRNLINRGSGMTDEQASKLIERDENEIDTYGQRTRGTFQLADFFLDDTGDDVKLKNDICRITDLIFGNPYITPTFDEYAMFQAFSASLRSADLSRQVGAVICMNDEVISSGANDCPKFGGGLYWPQYSPGAKKIEDAEMGRDYKVGRDTNYSTLQDIIGQIIKGFGPKTAEKVKKSIETSDLPALTEFGRMVHAEMEAILHCSRNSISCRGASLYATTFPCHNCAKHIIAAGIKKVIYVEPYPKSRAFSFYKDAISSDIAQQESRVVFLPFIGVGPRQFFELFSMNLSSGYKLVRKSPNGDRVDFDPLTAEPRLTMDPFSYIDLEETAVNAVNEISPKLSHENTNKKNSKQKPRGKK